MFRDCGWVLFAVFVGLCILINSVENKERESHEDKCNAERSEREEQER